MTFKHQSSMLCHMAFKHWPLGYTTWIELKQLRLSLKLDKVPMFRNLQPKFLGLGLRVMISN
jgi:hypothetical protein